MSTVTTLLYQHPDGHVISYDRDAMALVVTDSDGQWLTVPCGPLGLIEVGKQMVAMGGASHETQ